MIDQNQVESFKKIAKQAGLSGVAYIDFNPNAGLVRLKLSVTPVEGQGLLTSNFATVLAQASQMFGLQVKVHEDQGEKAGARP